ncbi:hypothetical protein OSB04_000575 [Centaurea solstitialis]|uniref:DDE Tnp4 domain-containing protein n=1 Tax=Centaurea solstitialis TaxID=347529 RepID=A0AA38TR48_9ASTR|nr:hypothetical protein OSB04_000575 [Centaurea solstitialis]
MKYAEEICRRRLEIYQVTIDRTSVTLARGSEVSQSQSSTSCLRAIDGTYIEVTVPESDKPRYRTIKGNIAINVLGACTRDMKFVYVLSNWKGSATDSRVLRDAVIRNNGFNVPLGNYYLANAMQDMSMLLSKKRKRKASETENMYKILEKGLKSVSEEMGKLVSIVGTPGLETLTEELAKMGFDDRQNLAIGVHFSKNPVQLRFFNGMADRLKPFL